MHLKRCLITEVSCLSPRSNGKYLVHGEITNLCHAFVKRSGLGSHLGFKLVPKRKKHFFLRRIYHLLLSRAFGQKRKLSWRRGSALFTGRPKIYLKKRFGRRLGSYLDSSTIMQNEFLGRMCLPRPKQIPGGFLLFG